MENNVLEVLKPGLATTIQDLGRPGFQQYGVVASGAMDAFALQVGNILVGNRRDAAGIEITVLGPTIRILRDTVLAICGADLSPRLDSEDIGLWKSFTVRAGQTLTFGKPRSCAYAYMAVAGGIAVPAVMGSRSTYTKATIGGLEGRYLQKRDQLEAGISSTGRGVRLLSPDLIPDYKSNRRIRVVLGPDREAFDTSSMERFLTESYKMTTQSDRMGARLDGPALWHVNRADIFSDAIFPGTIQVPANGQPIILLADRQTTGGYTRIATVITVDLAYVAQQLAGNELTFEAVSVEKAQRLFVEQEKFLRKLSLGTGVN